MSISMNLGEAIVFLRDKGYQLQAPADPSARTGALQRGQVSEGYIIIPPKESGTGTEEVVSYSVENILALAAELRFKDVAPHWGEDHGSKDKYITINPTIRTETNSDGSIRTLQPSLEIDDERAQAWYKDAPKAPRPEEVEEPPRIVTVETDTGEQRQVLIGGGKLLPQQPQDTPGAQGFDDNLLTLIGEGRINEALRLDQIRDRLNEKRMSREEAARLVMDIAQTPQEFQTWVDAMAGMPERFTTQGMIRRAVATGAATAPSVVPEPAAVQAGGATFPSEDIGGEFYEEALVPRTIQEPAFQTSTVPTKAPITPLTGQGQAVVAPLPERFVAPLDPEGGTTDANWRNPAELSGVLPVTDTGFGARLRASGREYLPAQYTVDGVNRDFTGRIEDAEGNLLTPTQTLAAHQAMSDARRQREATRAGTVPIPTPGSQIMGGGAVFSGSPYVTYASTADRMAALPEDWSQRKRAMFDVGQARQVQARQQAFKGRTPKVSLYR